MNKLEVNQVGGFPMTTRILDEIQKAHAVFNAFGGLAGNFTILDGCVTAGSTVGNGFVFINGEVFEFRGGSAQTKVIIKEDVENLAFQNGNSNPVIKTRYVTFGTGVGAFNWVDFKRPIETKEISGLIQRIVALEARPLVGNIPVGLIALWNRPANEIPAGWQPYTSLAGRVPVGFNSLDDNFNVLGRKAGSKDTVLVRHKHTVTGSGNVNNGQTGGNLGNKTARWDSGSGTLLDGQVSEEGEDGINKNLQPYEVVHFIIYLGNGI